MATTSHTHERFLYRALHLLTEGAIYCSCILALFYSALPEGVFMQSALIERTLYFLLAFAAWSALLVFVRNSFRGEKRWWKSPGIRVLGILVLGATALTVLSYLKERYTEDLFHLCLGIFSLQAISSAFLLRGHLIPAALAEALMHGGLGYFSFVLISLNWPYQALLPALSFTSLVAGLRLSEIAVSERSVTALSRAGLMGLFLAPALILISHSLGDLPGSYLAQVFLAPLLLKLASWQHAAAGGAEYPPAYLFLVRVTFLSYLAIVALSKVMS